MISTEGGDLCSRNASVEETLTLNISALHRQGMLLPGRRPWSWAEAPHLKLEIESDGDRLTLLHKHGFPASVRLSSTECTFGGSRLWFHCPAPTCGRRAGRLYCVRWGTWRCRTCLGLRYESQLERETKRGLRRAFKIRTKLGGPPRLGPFPPKPRWMHLDTYYRLHFEAHQAELAYAHAVRDAAYARYAARHPSAEGR
jgi:hypothetical protein